jgi:hypothetical protein
MLFVDACKSPSEERPGYQSAIDKTGKPLLTFHVGLHFFNETMDNLKRLGSGCPSLILSQPFQPLEDVFNVVFPKKLLSNRLYVPLRYH